MALYYSVFFLNIYLIFSLQRQALLSTQQIGFIQTAQKLAFSISVSKIDFDIFFFELQIYGLKEKIIYSPSVDIFIRDKDDWVAGNEVTFRKYATV